MSRSIESGAVMLIGMVIVGGWLAVDGVGKALNDRGPFYTTNQFEEAVPTTRYQHRREKLGQALLGLMTASAGGGCYLYGRRRTEAIPNRGAVTGADRA